MRIKWKADSTSWYVCRFVDEHNQDLLPAKFVSYLPTYRKISDVDVAHIKSLRQAATDGDVNAALRYFNSCARADVNMSWRYQVGDEQQMCDLFWSDGCSQHDYKIFGDVLAFDAMYGRKKYNLSVLGRFLECMGGKAPKAIITDGDRAMQLAIQEVFPETYHRLCA
ncbi:hypothetical protein AHAS_Ahas03G0188300 [Arachis hypogaea]